MLTLYTGCTNLVYNNDMTVTSSVFLRCQKCCHACPV